MIISHQYKFIVVLNPKCGSNSIDSALKYYDRPNKKDVRSQRYHNSLDDLTFDYDEYFTAIFVRNPWDRIISYYKYIVEKSPNHRYHNVLRWHGFEKFIRNPSMAKLSQCSARAKGVNWVGRFENLNEDFSDLCQRCGLPNLELPRLNSTDRSENDLNSYFTSQELIDLVGEQYKTDIELYGYEFPKGKDK